MSIQSQPVPNPAVASLLEKFGPKASTFSVTLSTEDVLTFKSFSNYKEWGEFKKKAAEFVKKCRENDRIPPAWAPYMPLGDEGAYYAFTISELAVEPAFTIFDAIQLLGAPWLIDGIIAALDANQMSYLNSQAVEAYEDEKKDSKTDSTEGNAASLGTSTVVI